MAPRPLTGNAQKETLIPNGCANPEFSRSQQSAFRIEGRILRGLCRTVHGPVTDALVWSIGDADLAQEAADEAMVEAYKRWNRVSKMANPAGWTYRVGLNWARGRLRRRHRGQELSRLVSAVEAATDELANLDLVRALAVLSIDHRSVLVLRYLLGYPEQETADILGVRVGTVKSRTRRALDHLHRELGVDYR